MTILAWQIAEEIRGEVRAQLAEIRGRDQTLQRHLESTAWNGEYIQPGDKYTGDEFNVVPPTNMPDLALANCPSFVVPRHFISG